MAESLNYATDYLYALDQRYPSELHFNELRSAANDSRFKWVDAQTIKIPHITTTGRVSASRDNIATAQRNYENSWETKTLGFHRKWSTLVHPLDMEETRIKTIAKITDVFNSEQKIPEKDAYIVSKLYADWSTTNATEGYVGRTADTTALTTASVLGVFDSLMLAMDNALVPATGRILYVTFEVLKMLENAQIDANNTLGRQINVESGPKGIDRRVSRLDEVMIKGVPASLMKTAYNFTTGFAPADGAGQINMFLVHPSAVITPEQYEFVKLDDPSAVTEGKYIYFEESYEDAFVLNYKADALQFNITTGSDTSTTN